MSIMFTHTGIAISTRILQLTTSSYRLPHTATPARRLAGGRGTGTLVPPSADAGTHRRPAASARVTATLHPVVTVTGLPVVIVKPLLVVIVTLRPSATATLRPSATATLRPSATATLRPNTTVTLRPNVVVTATLQTSVTMKAAVTMPRMSPLKRNVMIQRDAGAETIELPQNKENQHKRLLQQAVCGGKGLGALAVVA